MGERDWNGAHPPRMAVIDFWVVVEKFYADAPRRGTHSCAAHLHRVFVRLLVALDGVTVTHVAQPTIWANGGMTATVHIEESHAAIHTWPERGVAWVQLATCGDPDALNAFRKLVLKHIGPEQHEGSAQVRMTAPL